jgi:hypothetical protein
MKWKLKEQYKGSMKQDWFFESRNTIDKSLAKLTKRMRMKTQM